MTTKFKGDGSIEDIVFAKLSEDWSALTEASINRIAHHVNNGHFGIVTSWRGGSKGMSNENPAQQRKYTGNQSKFHELRKKINSDGFGYHRMIGYGAVEKTASKSYREHSVFVPGKGKTAPLSKEHMRGYADHYKQESFIYSGPDTNHEVHLFDTKTGNSIHKFGKFEKGKLGDYHSRLIRGKDKTAERSATRRATETGSKKHAFAFEGEEPMAWEYLPERTVSSMRAWQLAEENVARDLGIDLKPTMARIEEKLSVRRDELFDDEESTV